MGYERNVAKMLREQLPQDIYEFLVLAGEVADVLGYGAYLVGAA